MAIYEWLLGQFWVDSGQIQRYQQNLESYGGSCDPGAGIGYGTTASYAAVAVAAGNPRRYAR